MVVGAKVGNVMRVLLEYDTYTLNRLRKYAPSEVELTATSMRKYNYCNKKSSGKKSAET